MESLPKNEEKINPAVLFHGLVALIIIGSSIGGFLLGRASVGAEKPRETVLGTSSTNSDKVIIDTSLSEQFFEAEETRSTAEKTIMASINGTRYYPDGCTAGSSIDEKNRIWFATENEAKMAGYSLAKACQ